MANAYVMRTNMSVAIVAMVNHTWLDMEAGEEILDDECPDYNATAQAVSILSYLTFFVVFMIYYEYI